MKLGLTVGLLSILMVAGGLAAGCSDENGSQGGAGAAGGAGSGGGSGGSGGTGGTGGMGMGGAGGSGGMSGSGGSGGQSPVCYGDKDAWATVKAAPVPCQKNSDCCVVVNGCLNEAVVVTSANKGTAKTAWPYCDDQCTDCIPPSVAVECGPDKTCVGYKVPFEDNPPPDLSQDHCGIDEPPIMMMSPALSFSCGS